MIDNVEYLSIKIVVDGSHGTRGTTSKPPPAVVQRAEDWILKPRLLGLEFVSVLPPVLVPLMDLRKRKRVIRWRLGGISDLCSSALCGDFEVYVAARVLVVQRSVGVRDEVDISAPEQTTEMMLERLLVLALLPFFRPWSTQ